MTFPSWGSSGLYFGTKHATMSPGLTDVVVSGCCAAVDLDELMDLDLEEDCCTTAGLDELDLDELDLALDDADNAVGRVTTICMEKTQYCMIIH